MGHSDGRTIEGALESLHNRLEAYASACDNAHELLVSSRGNRPIFPFRCRYSGVPLISREFYYQAKMRSSNHGEATVIHSVLYPVFSQRIYPGRSKKTSFDRQPAPRLPSIRRGRTTRINHGSHLLHFTRTPTAGPFLTRPLGPSLMASPLALSLGQSVIWHGRATERGSVVCAAELPKDLSKLVGSSRQDADVEGWDFKISPKQTPKKKKNSQPPVSAPYL